MKLEKLTENKIRIIIDLEDLNTTHTDIRSIMTEAITSQKLFYEILDKAEKELNFYTEGCKLLIEAFSSSDGILVFTITKYDSKYSDYVNSSNHVSSAKKKLTVKRKMSNLFNKQLICKFDSFDDFCEFCDCINAYKSFDIKKFSKNISLYLYNGTYYLVVKNININYTHAKVFHLVSTEFGKNISFSDVFENKLIEHATKLTKGVFLLNSKKSQK